MYSDRYSRRVVPLKTAVRVLRKTWNFSKLFLLCSHIIMSYPSDAHEPIPRASIYSWVGFVFRSRLMQRRPAGFEDIFHHLMFFNHNKDPNSSKPRLSTTTSLTGSSVLYWVTRLKLKWDRERFNLPTGHRGPRSDHRASPVKRWTILRPSPITAYLSTIIIDFA